MNNPSRYHPDTRRPAWWRHPTRWERRQKTARDLVASIIIVAVGYLVALAGW
jgi:hypothetical protein